MQLTGRVDTVTVKPNKFGKNQTSIKVDGEWYGFFEATPPIFQGNLVSFDAEQKGKWWNGKDLKILEGVVVTDPGAYFDKAVPASPRAASDGDEWKRHGLEVEQRIVRQNATSSAIAFVRLQIDVAPEHFKNLTTDELWEELWGRVVEYQGRIYELNMNAPQGA